MNHIITYQDPEFIRYAAKVLEVDGFGKCKTLAVSDGKEITLIAIYSKYDGYHCELSAVARKPTWATRSTLALLFGYPFEQLGCKRMTVIIREDNKRAISVCERLGFVQETNTRGLRAYCQDGTNAHIYGILKDECKWIKHGKN